MNSDNCPIDMPGSELGLDMPKSQGRLQHIETKLLEAQSIVNSIVGSIESTITGTLDSVCKAGDSCSGIVEGQLISGLDGVEAKLRKPLLKVEQSLIDRISLIYTLLGSFGVSWPTDQDVAYGLVTLDYLGSVYVTPREFEITGEGSEQYQPTREPSSGYTGQYQTYPVQSQLPSYGSPN